MKKRIITALVAVGCVLTALGGGLISEPQTAKASVSNRIVTEEYFNGDTLSNEWKATGATLDSEYSAMRFDGAYYWEGAIALNAYELKDYNRFVAELKVIEYESDGWFALAFGGENLGKAFFEYDGYFRFQNANACLVYSEGGFAATQVQTAAQAFAKAKEGRATLETELIKAEDGNYDVTAKWGFSDGSEQSFSFTDVAVSNAKKYFALNSSGMVWDLIGFKAYDQTGAEIFSDDFTKNTLTYVTEDSSNGNWHVARTYAEDEVYVSKIGAASLSEAGARLVHASPLVNPVQADEAYRLRFSLLKAELPVGTSFGLGVGLKTQEGALDSGTFLGVTRRDADTCAIVRRTGEAEETLLHFPAALLVNADGAMETEWVFSYDFSVRITLGTQKVTARSVAYEGYWGFGVLGTGANVRVDDLCLTEYGTVYFDTEDASNSFDGVKKWEAYGENYTNYYIDNTKWFLGPGVHLSNWTAKDTGGKLLFSNATAYSCFGYRGKYDECIVRFDLTMASGGVNGQEFGLSFHKSTFFTHPERSTSVGVFFNGYGAEDRSAIKGYNCLTAEGMKETEMAGTPVHFWKDRTTTYNVLYLLRNNAVEVYFKESTAPDTELSVCRARFVDVDTSGYLSVYGLNGISFSISKFSVTNIGRTANGESPAALRSDFSGALPNALKTENAEVKDGALVLGENGSVGFSGNYGFSILNFDLLTPSGTVFVELGNDRAIGFDFTAKKITFTQSGTTQTAEFPSNRNFASCSALTVDIRLQNGTAKIGLRHDSEAADKIYDEVASFAYLQAEIENVRITSATGAKIDALKAYALTGDFYAATVDYSPEFDEATAWIPKTETMSKPKYGKSEKTNVGLIIGLSVGGVIVAAGIIVTVIVLSKKKKGEGK